MDWVLFLDFILMVCFDDSVSRCVWCIGSPWTQVFLDWIKLLTHVEKCKHKKEGQVFVNGCDHFLLQIVQPSNLFFRLGIAICSQFWQLLLYSCWPWPYWCLFMVICIRQEKVSWCCCVLAIDIRIIDTLVVYNYPCDSQHAEQWNGGRVHGCAVWTVDQLRTAHHAREHRHHLPLHWPEASRQQETPREVSCACSNGVTHSAHVTDLNFP